MDVIGNMQSAAQLDLQKKYMDFLSNQQAKFIKMFGDKRTGLDKRKMQIRIMQIRSNQRDTVGRTDVVHIGVVIVKTLKRAIRKRQRSGTG